MKTRKKSIIGCMILLAAVPCLAVDVTGPYFGQTPPGATPQLFAPGILTQPNGVVAVTRIAFSPDGNECFFSGPTDWNYSSTRMYYTKCVNNVWTPHVLTSFFPGYSCRQPFFSADGNTLYFSSNKNGTSDIWMAGRTAQGWGNPQVLPAPINTTSYYDGMYTQTTNGTAYIESNRPGSQGFDVWQIPAQQPGQPQQIQNLGATVNTSGDDNDPVVSPDGRYLIFGSNYNDLSVTFNQGNGSWTAPVNLNQYCPGINTGNQEYAPNFSHDGRYLFFTRVSDGGVHWVANPIPRPDPNGPVLNLSTNERFGTIQAAVIYAQAGDTIEIQPGRYLESVVLDKDINVQSVDPNDPFYIGGTIIQGDPDGPVVTLQGNTAGCTLAGLTLRAGSTGISGTATQATIRNCRIMDNTGHGLELPQESNPSLQYCLITTNGQTGITMHATTSRHPRHCKPTIADCVIVQNGLSSLVGGQPILIDSIFD